MGRTPESGTVEEERLIYQERLSDFAKAISALEMMSKYTQPLKNEQLKATVESTKRALVQSQRDYEAALDQLSAERSAAQTTLDAHQERLRHYEDQINKCTVRAPIDGSVTYASSNDEDEIAAGSILRQRQRILVLHDLSQFQIRAPLSADEAQHLHVGMIASIDIAERSSDPCAGVVTAMQQRGTTRDAIVAVQDSQSLRPGATATVEIFVQRLADVTRIPLQSFKSQQGQNYCYVLLEHGLEQRLLTLGAVGDHYAEVMDGLHEGDSVVLDVEAADAVAVKSGPR